jgi:Carboxypeptidase regulatory-like domain/TonB dependent receptor
MTKSASIVSLALLVFMVSAATAQVIPTGSVDGAVTDTSAAILPGTTVVLTNTNTNETRTASANEQGVFFFNLVPVGNYRLEAELAGFKKFVQTITVELGRKITVDIRLEVGEVREVIEVQTDAPVLETSTASISTSVNNRYVAGLPLAGRNVLQLAVLSAGIVQTANPAPSSLNEISGTSYFSTNGANQRMNEFLMDGVPNNVSDRVAYIPPVDQVQEFNIQTNSFDSEYGHSGGAYINVSTKSGTNRIQGTVYEFLRNDALNANSFFNNRSGIDKPALRYNQFGAAVGGPIIKNKTFWFFNYEGVESTRPSNTIFTVPSELERRGDFSQTFNAAGQLIRIYDPFSTRPDPAQAGRFIRDQFLGNVIPSNRLDPVAQNIIKTFVPLPNRSGDPNSGTNNHVKVVATRQPIDNFTVRLDHSLGTTQRLFGRFSMSKTPQSSDYLVPVGGLNLNNRVQTSVGVGDTIAFGSTTMLTINGGFTRWTQEGTQPDYDISTLGFAPSFVNSLQQVKVPRLNNPDMVFVGAIEGSWYEHTNTFAWSASMNLIRGRHNLKFGHQTQVKQNNSQGANSPAGNFTFSRGFTQGPDPNTTGSAIGHGIASFLIATPERGFTTLNVSNAPQSPYYGFYFQDDFRLSSRLTLNLGIRYELNPAATERFNHSVIGWGFGQPNPIEAQARANYAQAPIPELPVDLFRVEGGLLFASPDNRRYAPTDMNDWSPRFGFAYRVTEKTVLRGGYGLFYSYWPAPFVRQNGFSSDTPMVSTLDGITPVDLLSNPFPNGLIAPPGDSQGLLTLLGTNVAVYSQFRHSPYNERWELGIQQELSSNLRLEVNYVGSTAQSLYVGNNGGGSGGEMNRELHYLPAEHLALGAGLNQRVSNPFFGLIPSNLTLGASTISKQNLLSTFPHVSQLQIQRETVGRAYYHGGQASLTKRFSRGFQFLSSYTFQRQIEKVQFLNDSDPAPSKAIGDLWRPHRFTFAGVWDLPYRDQTGVKGKLLGGWQVSVIQIFQSGQALLLPPGTVYTGEDPRLDPDERSIDGWFNPRAFAVQPAFTLRTLSVRLARLQGDAINTWDFALGKKIAITERFRTEFRWEMFNALNRAQFGAPTLNPASGAYGRITSTANNPREMQFGLKLVF